jgi:hypothetical protein
VYYIALGRFSDFSEGTMTLSVTCGDTNGSSDNSNNAAVIAGACVGSIVGAVAVVSFVILKRRYRRSRVGASPSSIENVILVTATPVVNIEDATRPTVMAVPVKL